MCPNDIAALVSRLAVIEPEDAAVVINIHDQKPVPVVVYRPTEVRTVDSRAVSIDALDLDSDKPV